MNQVRGPENQKRNYGKLFLNLFKIFFGPIRIYGFYHYDVATDLLQTGTLFSNCHYKYGIASIFLIVISYIITTLHLRFYLRVRWSKAIFYPFYHR